MNWMENGKQIFFGMFSFLCKKLNEKDSSLFSVSELMFRCCCFFVHSMMIITKLNQTFGEKNFFSFAECFSLDVLLLLFEYDKRCIFKTERESRVIGNHTRISWEFCSTKKIYLFLNITSIAIWPEAIWFLFIQLVKHFFDWLRFLHCRSVWKPFGDRDVIFLTFSYFHAHTNTYTTISTKN